MDSQERSPKSEEEKGQEMADRLTRLWVPRDFLDGERKWWRERKKFSFTTRLSPTTHFVYVDVSWQRSSDVYSNRGRTFSLASKDLDSQWRIFYRSNDHELSASFSKNGQTHSLSLDGFSFNYLDSCFDERTEELRHILSEWLPLVRRNAHLMGLDIECSAHERLEWKLWFERVEVSF